MFEHKNYFKNINRRTEHDQISYRTDEPTSSGLVEDDPNSSRCISRAFISNSPAVGTLSFFFLNEIIAVYSNQQN